MKKVFLLATTLCLLLVMFSGCDTTSTNENGNDVEPSKTVVDTGSEASTEIDMEQVSIVVNGTPVLGAYFTIIDNSIYIPIMEIALVFNERTDWPNWNPITDEIFFPGLRGDISFIVGSADFNIGDEVIALLQPSVKIEDRVYVPMQFFTDVFGMRNIYYKNGHIFIYD